MTEKSRGALRFDLSAATAPPEPDVGRGGPRRDRPGLFCAGAFALTPATGLNASTRHTDPSGFLGVTDTSGAKIYCADFPARIPRAADRRGSLRARADSRRRRSRCRGSTTPSRDGPRRPDDPHEAEAPIQIRFRRRRRCPTRARDGSSRTRTRHVVRSRVLAATAPANKTWRTLEIRDHVKDELPGDRRGRGRHGWSLEVLATPPTPTATLFFVAGKPSRRRTRRSG